MAHFKLAAGPVALAVLVGAACGSRDELQSWPGAATGSGGAAGGGAAGGAAGASTSGGLAGGDAGEDGAADSGPPPLPEQIARACVIATSCAEPFVTTGYPWWLLSPSTCADGFGQLGWYAQGFLSPDPELAARLLACAQAAAPGDCEGFRSCFGGGWVTLSRCHEGAMCDGSKLVMMGETPFFDCAAIGATCVDLMSGAQRACCNAELCTDFDQVTCDAGGATGTFCHGWGAFMTFDCSLTGRVCTPDPYYLCEGTGAACDVTEPAPECTGAVASYCAGGRLASFDCSQNELRSGCGGDTYGLPCIPRGSDCDPQGFAGACQGAELTLCVDGYLELVSCTDLGFSTCDLPAAGYARCL